jgi:hypothetical protein
MPPQTDPSNLGHFDPNATVALIGNPVTAAVLDSDLDAGPVNFSDPAIVITRDPVIGAVMAFDRRVDEDLVPIFSRHSFKKFPQATMIDADSGSAWTPDGRALDGTLKGKKLTRLDVEDQVYWSAARFWFRNPPLLEPVPGKNENFRKYAGSKSE